MSVFGLIVGGSYEIPLVLSDSGKCFIFDLVVYYGLAVNGGIELFRLPLMLEKTD